MDSNKPSFSGSEAGREVPAEISRQVANACALLSHHLGHSLLAIHLFGSAVAGGLKPQSDIDLLVTVDAPLTSSIRHALMMDLQTVSAWPVADGIRPLEVTVVQHAAITPWRYPPIRECQYGEWLRDELAAGRIQGACKDPDLAILITQARAKSICLLHTPADALFAPVPRRDLFNAYKDTIDQWRAPVDWAGDESNVVLTLARIWFSLSTGRFAPKDSAAQWALPQLPAEHQAVLQSALMSYLHPETGNMNDHQVQITAYVHYVKAMMRAMNLFPPDNNPTRTG